MEDAITEFFSSAEPAIATARERIILRFSKGNADPLWHAQHFCRQLVAENPLRINSITHGAFWATMEDHVLSLLRRQSGEYGDYYVIVNHGERVHRMYYSQALLAIILTIVDRRLTDRLVSVYNFPEHILIAFLKRAEMREVFFRSFAHRCEDRLDIYSLYSRGLISHDTLHDTLDEYNDENGASFYITPPPEMDEAAMDVDNDPAQLDLHRLILPERQAPSDFSIPNKVAMESTLVIYGYLWSSVQTVVDAVQFQFKTAHGQACTCHEKILNMRVLMPLLRAFVEQSLDSRTLARPAARLLFDVAPALGELLDSIALKIAAYIRGEPPAPELETYIFNSVGETASMEEVASALSGSSRWVKCNVTEIPVQALLARLDSEYLFARTGALLRQFLSNKPRDQYIAYQLPLTCQLMDLKNTLHHVRTCFQAEFPALADMHALRSLDRVFLVSKPSTMTLYRTLMLYFQFSNKIDSGNTAVQLPHTYALLRNYIMQANVDSEMIHHAATLSLIGFLQLCLESFGYVLKVFSERDFVDCCHLPSEPFAFGIYRHLPKLCDILERMQVEPEEQAQILYGFCRKTYYRKCDSAELKSFVYKLEQRIGDGHPMQELATNICKTYKKCNLKNYTNISRRACTYVALYEVLFASEEFSDEEIVQYTLAFSKHIGRSTRKSVKKVPSHRMTLRPLTQNYFAKFNETMARVADEAVEFWERSSFEYHSRNVVDELSKDSCADQTTPSDILDNDILFSHYENSRYGHTFAGISKTKGIDFTTSEISALCRVVLRMEHKAYGLETAQTGAEALLHHWIYEKKPYLMPLSLEPKIFFENVFYLHVHQNWPKTSNSALDRICSSEDLPINTAENILHHISDDTSLWKPSNETTKSVGGDFTYTQCIRAYQSSLKVS